MLSVAYVGNQNRNQSEATEINLPGRSPRSSTITGTNYNSSLPFVGYHSLKVDQNDGSGHYNSMQVELHSNLRQGLQLQAAYTLARAIDPTTGTGGDGFDLNTVSNPYQGWKYDVGPSVFDRTHVAFVNFVYDLPIFRNSTNRCVKTTVGGWQVSGIVSMMSGAPLNLGVNSGTTSASIFPGGELLGNRPDLIGTIRYPNRHHLVQRKPKPYSGLIRGLQQADPSALCESRRRRLRQPGTRCAARSGPR